MIYDKNNKYLRIFIINHKNTLNIIYLVGLLLVANKRFMKIFAPPPCREVFVKIARDFQINCFILILNVYELMFSIFRFGLFYNEVLLDTVV
jgi:hypothetical protein